MAAWEETPSRGLGSPMSIFPRTKVFKPTERINVQFRAEIFNIFNRANFYAPAWNVFSGGTKYAGSAGTIGQTTTGPRLIQLALKVVF